MADTLIKVVRLIDNIKLELYESGRKKYVQIWDPTGNNVYNEDDKGPSGIRNPERGKKFQSAEPDQDIIRTSIGSSKIVEYYKQKNNRKTTNEYFNYLQDPFNENPPAKRIYGGGGLGTPESDDIGPSPYYLNNGCKINIKWIGDIPNPDFKLGTFSTPDDVEDYNKSLDPKGPPRWLKNQPILSDIDETYSKENPTLRPQSEWILETYYDPGNMVTVGVTYSNYRDKPLVRYKYVSVTLPDGFVENDGIGYLEYVGDRSLVYSNGPKGTVNSNMVVLPGGQVMYERVDASLRNFGDTKDESILKTIINSYQSQVSELYNTSMYSYDLKLCSPDTQECSLIEYKSPLINLSEVGATPSVEGAVPSLIPKKVKLNVIGLPGVTNLSGETDGSIKVKAKVSLPDFRVYLGDPPGPTSSDASGVNPFILEDDVDNPDPYEESEYSGPEEESIIINGEILILFSNDELKRDDSTTSEDGSGSGVNFGGSNVNTPTGSVSNSTIQLPADLKGVQNSSVITKQSMGDGKYRSIGSDIVAPSGAKSLGKDITRCMNEFISDVISPFSTWLKSKYPALYKGWYITSATRGYVPAGGSLTSQHMKGQAIDSQILGSTAKNPDKNIELMNAILEWYKSNPVGYGQILFETRTSNGKNSCWIHWSYTRGVKRLMFARFSNDSTKNTPANKTGSYVLPPLTKASLGF
jgi:hypothetical protein